LFARSFVSSGRSLVDYLRTSGQVLFQRAPTRQVLEHLAAVDRPEFRVTVASLLASGEVRMHLKDVVLTLLGGLDASSEDWMALEPVTSGTGYVAVRTLGLLSESRWFDAADALGRWEPWLADPAMMECVARSLVFAARDRPHRVADLVRPHVGSSNQWRA